MGKKIEQVLSTIQVLCLTLKRFLPKLLHTKKIHAQPKGEKYFMPRKLPNTTPTSNPRQKKKWSVSKNGQHVSDPGEIATTADGKL